MVGYIAGNGGASTSGFPNSNLMKDHIPVVPGEVLHFSADSTANDSFRWDWYDLSGKFIDRKYDFSGGMFDWTVPDNAYSIWVSYPSVANASLTIVSSPST